MFGWLKDLFLDKATFTQYARTVLAAVWAAQETGVLPTFAESTVLWYATKWMLVLAFLLRAGDANVPKGQR